MQFSRTTHSCVFRIARKDGRFTFCVNYLYWSNRSSQVERNEKRERQKAHEKARDEHLRIQRGYREGVGLTTRGWKRHNQGWEEGEKVTH